jgi:hypothetical protein
VVEKATEKAVFSGIYARWLVSCEEQGAAVSGNRVFIQHLLQKSYGENKPEAESLQLCRDFLQGKVFMLQVRRNCSLASFLQDGPLHS